MILGILYTAQMHLKIKDHRTTRFWAYATSFGAAWGIWELTIGTFFHMLKLPLVSPILAASAGALLIAERQFIPIRGISLATGLVAAMCKSISPDGTILGPMIGIMSEALVVELVFLLIPSRAPFSIISSPMAGALATLCPLVHKLVSQFIFYGGTIFSLYSKILKKTALNLSLIDATWILTFILLGFGVLFGYLGLWVGQKALRQMYVLFHQDDPKTFILELLNQRKKITVKTESFVPNLSPLDHPQYKLPQKKKTIFFISIFLISMLIQFFPHSHKLTGPTISLILITMALLLVERRALGKVWKPKFWLFSIPIILLSGLFLGVRDSSQVEFYGLSVSGLIAGVLMLERAGWILSLTAWLSLTLNRGLVQSWFQKNGYPHLGHAITAAFGIMQELRPHAGASISKIINLFAIAGHLAETSAFKSQGSSDPVFLGIIGTQKSGKTTTILSLAEQLQKVGVQVSGICQPRLENGFTFDSNGWDWGREHLQIPDPGIDIVFVDELGRLESKGLGHIPSLYETLDNKIYILGIQEAHSALIANYVGGFVPIVVI